MADADEYRRQLAAIDEELAAVYRRRRAVQERFADEYPVVLPRASRRTETQQKIARCPRCGGKIPEQQ